MANKKARALAIEYHNKTTRTYAQLEHAAMSDIPIDQKKLAIEELDRRIYKYGVLTWFWYDLAEKMGKQK
jgi:hypothetical protein